MRAARSAARNSSRRNVTWAHDPFRNYRAIFFGGGKEYRIAEISPEI